MTDSCSSSNSFSSQICLIYSFLSLCTNIINLRQSIIFLSMMKFIITDSQILKLLLSISIINRPIANSNLTSNYLLIISSCQYIDRLLDKIITSQNYCDVLSSNNMWYPRYFRIDSNFYDIRCLRNSFERIVLIWDRVRNEGRMNVILVRSYRSKCQVTFWQNCRILSKYFSSRRLNMIWSMASIRTVLLPMLMTQYILSVSKQLLGNFQFSGLCNPKIGLIWLSILSKGRTVLKEDMDLGEVMRQTHRSWFLNLCLCWCSEGWSRQFMGCTSSILNLLILKVKSIYYYFWQLLQNILLPGYYNQSSLFWFVFILSSVNFNPLRKTDKVLWLGSQSDLSYDLFCYTVSTSDILSRLSFLKRASFGFCNGFGMFYSMLTYFFINVSVLFWGGSQKDTVFLCGCFFSVGCINFSSRSFEDFYGQDSDDWKQQLPICYQLKMIVIVV